MLSPKNDIYETFKHRTAKKLKKAMNNLRSSNYKVIKDQVKLLVGYKISVSKLYKPEDNVSEICFLGKGGFGTVFKASYLDETVAVKKTMACPSTNIEIEALETMRNCENIVSLIDKFKVKRPKQLSEVWQIQEYCDCGDLRQVMDSLSCSLSIQEIKAICSDVLNALCYIHSKGFIHKDIKALNLLLKSDGLVKVCDFGTACKKIGNFCKSSHITSDLWTAPELLTEHEFNESVDIWSLGITLLELYKKKPPFSKLAGTLALGTIAGLSGCSRASQLTQLGISLNNKFEVFVSKILIVDKNRRLSASQLKEIDDIKLVQGTTILKDLSTRVLMTK